MEVRINHIRQGEVARAWRFDALAIGLRDFKADAELDALAELIASGLSGSGHVLLEVVAFARIGDGQEVFPSQELILDKGDKKGQKSKTLYAPFLSCLYGSEQARQQFADVHAFLSCLYGSERLRRSWKVTARVS